jgi:MFS family permease
VNLPDSFRSLRIRNFRRYFLGQVLSLAGTWAQNLGLAWLVLELSDNSGVAVGIVTAAQALPTLLFGLWAGLLADRFDKRRFILVTQVALAITAGTLAVLDLSGAIELWMVYVLAFLFGAASACDMPARLSFVVEMVGPEELPNAIAVNSAVNNAARIVGPAVGGFVIATGGTGMCFLVNAISYLGTIFAVATMHRSELQQPARVARAKGQIREGFRYAMSERILGSSLAMLTVVSLFAFNFQVVLPLMAKLTFDGNATTYSLMSAVMGAGAFVSALVLATMPRPYGRRVALAALVTGISMLFAAIAPSLGIFIAILAVLGAAQIITASGTNALIQLDAAPAMRGRMTSLFSLTTSGTTPLGGALIGIICEALGARAGMVVGGIGALVAVALFGGILLRNHGPEPAPRVDDEAPSPAWDGVRDA